MADNAPRLAFEGVSRSFGRTLAVDELTLSVGAGEVVCLLGGSGCGKSTSLRIAAGVERQDRGTVSIDGRTVAGAGVFEPPEARAVGLMFQDYALFPHMSVARNVAFGLGRWSPADRRARVRECLAQVHMEEFADQYPATLSGGEQQRVALARALAPRPGVMLMDEPFSGLDVPRRDLIRDETWQVLKASGTATLLVTHDPKEAMRMADRIALMRAGRLVQVGTPEAIYNQPADAAAAAFFSDLNVFAARVEGDGRAQTPLGPVDVTSCPVGARVDVMARPHAIRLTGSDAPGALRAVVRRAVLLGPETLVEAELVEPVLRGEASEGENEDAGLIKVLVPGSDLPATGAVIGLTMRSEDLFVFPAPAPS